MIDKYNYLLVFTCISLSTIWWLRIRYATGGGLGCESVGKADLVSDHYDSKQSREAVDLAITCYPSPCFTTFAFRSSEERRLLLDLGPYGGTDPFGMFPLFWG